MKRAAFLWFSNHITTYIHAHVGEVAKGPPGLLERAIISLKLSILKVSYALHPRYSHHTAFIKQ